MDDTVQVSNNGAKFSLQWEGDAEPGIPVALDVLLAGNRHDEELCAWLENAPVGGCRVTGGGAAPACSMRRIV